MNSVGDEVDRYLRVVRAHLDALGETIDDALVIVPEELRAEVRTRWEEQVSQPIRRARVLSGTGGPKDWFGDWDPSAGYYWRRQRAYLLDRVGRSEPELESLDDATDKILAHLDDPRPAPIGLQQFRNQGLVLGYVQSGKTANFSALIAKAADAGYKLVIVLSGVHNALRQQTQRRLDRELGLVPGEGVGQPEPGRRWISLTTSELGGDFRPGTINANVLQGNERVLLVVKKNATVLRRLVEWMGSAAPSDLPVLIIDDEADQASINTGGNRPPLDEFVDLLPGDLGDGATDDELDPSVINGLVRALIAAFDRVAYVAYTATPFANVLINHEAVDRDVLEDLYPRDFIVSLPKPTGYVGTDVLFGRDALPGETDESIEGLDVIDLVPDWEIEDLVPGRGQAATFEPTIVPSLEAAFLDFILAIAARAQRSGVDNPATMLIHTHHRTVVQNQMGELVQAHVTELRQRWRYDRESIRPALRDRWERRFRPVVASIDVSRDVAFENLEEHIDRLFRDPLAVLVLNSTTQEVLDYEAEPTLKAVVIGGNRLSRGVTLEGLLVSYYVRRTQYFDTLLQMGRWFGYRADYVDLTRLWTTGQLAGWFSALALAEEELRRDIARYERERLTPLDFGPRIRTHPAMLVTAENKMGSARFISQNYAGHLIGTTSFRLDNRRWLEHNLEATRRVLARLGPPEDTSGARPSWSAVDWQFVDDYLADYRTDPRATVLDLDFVRKYLKEQVALGELVRWRISVREQPTEVADLGTEDLGIDGFRAVNLIARTRKKSAPNSIGSIINPATMQGRPGDGDEELGLPEAAILTARAAYSDGLHGSLGEALRSQRDPAEGLLLLYPVSRYSAPRPGSLTRLPLFDNPERDGVSIIGMALVFPASASAATVQYVVGSVGDLADDSITAYQMSPLEIRFRTKARIQIGESDMDGEAERTLSDLIRVGADRMVADLEAENPTRISEAEANLGLLVEVMVRTSGQPPGTPAGSAIEMARGLCPLWPFC